MFFNLFSKKKEITFDKLYDASVEDVWEAWTNPEVLKQWWGPKNTSVPECKIEPKVGGSLHIVMEAGEGMGSYKGMKWPLSGNFTLVEPKTKFAYTAKSWTEGERDTSEIDQDGELTLTNENGKTRMILKVTLNKTGPGAMMAAFGMKYGYKQQFEKLGELLEKQ